MPLLAHIQADTIRGPTIIVAKGGNARSLLLRLSGCTLQCQYRVAVGVGLFFFSFVLFYDYPSLVSLSLFFYFSEKTESTEHMAQRAGSGDIA